MKFDVVMKQLKVNILCQLLFYRLCHKTLILPCIWTFVNGFDSDLVGVTVRYCGILHFDTNQIDLGLGSRSQECEKAKNSVPIISHSFQLI